SGSHARGRLLFRTAANRHRGVFLGRSIARLLATWSVADGACRGPGLYPTAGAGVRARAEMLAHTGVFLANHARRLVPGCAHLSRDRALFGLPIPRIPIRSSFAPAGQRDVSSFDVVLVCGADDGVLAGA